MRFIGPKNIPFFVLCASLLGTTSVAMAQPIQGVAIASSCNEAWEKWQDRAWLDINSTPSPDFGKFANQLDNAVACGRRYNTLAKSIGDGTLNDDKPKKGAAIKEAVETLLRTYMDLTEAGYSSVSFERLTSGTTPPALKDLFGGNSALQESCQRPATAHLNAFSGKFRELDSKTGDDANILRSAFREACPVLSQNRPIGQSADPVIEKARIYNGYRELLDKGAPEAWLQACGDENKEINGKFKEVDWKKLDTEFDKFLSVKSGEYRSLFYKEDPITDKPDCSLPQTTIRAIR